MKQRARQSSRPICTQDFNTETGEEGELDVSYRLQ